MHEAARCQRIGVDGRRSLSATPSLERQMIPSQPHRTRSGWLLSAALLAAAAATGCATTAPVVYQPGKSSPAVAQRIAGDIEACRQQATDTVGLNARSPGQVAQGTARVGAVGFIATAVGGLVNSSRDVWQRARAGAAGGAAGIATKTLLEWNDPDKVHQEYVERCLDRRGHDVLGWR
jgi:hypothetical protein